MVGPILDSGGSFVDESSPEDDKFEPDLDVVIARGEFEDEAISIEPRIPGCRDQKCLEGMFCHDEINVVRGPVGVAMAQHGRPAHDDELMPDCVRYEAEKVTCFASRTARMMPSYSDILTCESSIALSMTEQPRSELCTYALGTMIRDQGATGVRLGFWRSQNGRTAAGVSVLFIASVQNFMPFVVLFLDLWAQCQVPPGS